MKNWIKQYYKDHNYPLDKLMIGGFRNEVNFSADMFNDILWFIYEDEIYYAKGTTDPGVYYTENPLNKKGAFHLYPGLHYEIWRIRKHRNKYIALCDDSQTKNVKGWRDKNRNGKNDDNIIDKGDFGINWHYANDHEFIKWASAGCQVTPDIGFFNQSIECAIASEQELFSYMLFDMKEIPTNLLIEAVIK